jgi:hypothetical protein
MTTMTARHCRMKDVLNEAYPDEDGEPFTYYIVGSLFKKGRDAGDIDCVSVLDEGGNKEELKPYEFVGYETGKPVEVFLVQLRQNFWLTARFDPSTGAWVIGKGSFEVILGDPTRATSCQIIKACRTRPGLNTSE